MNPRTVPQLPFDCWLQICKLVYDDGRGDVRHVLMTSRELSSVSYQLPISLYLIAPKIPRLPHIVERFHNIVCLNFSSILGDLDQILTVLAQQHNQNLQKLRSLVLSDRPTIPREGLTAFGMGIPFLTSLVCSNVGRMSRQDIDAISQAFQLLEVLDLGHPNAFVGDDHPDTARALVNLSLSTPRMREINLSSHSYINDHLFHNLLYNWRQNLEKVFICNCPNIAPVGINSYSFPDAPRVKSLVLSNTNLFQPNIFALPIFFNYLTTIKLFSCVISDHFLSSIKVLPLHTLLLNFCTEYTYRGLSGFLSQRRQIRHLDLSGAPWYMHDDQIWTLSLLLTDIISIDLTSCSRLTDFTVFILNTTCPSLSELYMGHTNVGEGSENFPDQLLLCPEDNTRLQTLSLSNQNFLNGEVMLIRIASIFRNLHHLDLGSCSGISDQLIGRVLGLCKEIRTLDISYTSIRSFGIGFVVLKLQQLNISGTAFNDEALHFISGCCPALKEVSLNECNSISNVGVSYLVEGCTRLQKIGLKHCDSLSHHLVDYIIFVRPKMRSIGTPTSFVLSDEVKVRYSNDGYQLV